MYVHILKLGFEEDHVHMYVSIPLSQPIPYVIQKLKWWSSIVIRKEFKKYLKQFYWEPELWAIGYFICTVWEVNDSIIQKYIEQQWKEDVEGIEVEL